MSWHDDCDTFDSRINASAKDTNFNDTEFLLVQDDAEDATGDKVSANKAILALISPVFYAQFYGPLSINQPPPIEDGTARGFKQLINFIYNPTSFEFPVDNVEEVFEISYFGHKYQIGSLVSQCRKLLAKFNVEGKELETLTWAVTTENGRGWEETLTAEYRLLLHRCWKQIEDHFVKIFPNGEIKEGQELLDENLMLKILGMKKLNASEDFILLVALDYYSKLVRNRPNVVQSKRLKVDSENEWNEKLVKIQSVITFNKVSPKKFAELFEKVVDKVPDTVMSSITKSVSSSWKDLNNLNRFSGDTVKRRMNISERDIQFYFDTSVGNWIHDDDILSDVYITFKTNQNAILHFRPAFLLCCKFLCDYGKVDCCEQDRIIFQNEGYFKGEILLRRTEDNDRNYEHSFYIEANKKVTLRYERSCKKSLCPLHLQRMDKFHFSKDNFDMEILEVNGQPISAPCYSFVDFLEFTTV